MPATGRDRFAAKGMNNSSRRERERERERESQGERGEEREKGEISNGILI